jgi:hypothetical protein
VIFRTARFCSFSKHRSRFGQERSNENCSSAILPAPARVSVARDGITFTASATQPAGYPNYIFDWYQLLTATTVKYLNSRVVQQTCTLTPGLDNADPYGSGATQLDAPGQLLLSSYSEETLNESFIMYLMWNSGLSNAIDVPLGYVTWSWTGDAIQSGGVWSKKSSGNSKTATEFVQSVSAQPN